ncbi:MAG: hypothetical protein H0U76_16200 [Ktedonobacteraceae bacterium]|nr:hypothetical protein [Ktedonobacteraceae bacterium]
MANQVAARLQGDDYQHLYAWQFVLELLMPKKNVRHTQMMPDHKWCGYTSVQ